MLVNKCGATDIVEGLSWWLGRRKHLVERLCFLFLFDYGITGY